MILELFTITLALILLFFILGVFTKVKALALLSGILSILFGLILGNEGIQISDGYSLITYTQANDLIVLLLTTLFILLGISFLGYAVATVFND